MALQVVVDGLRAVQLAEVEVVLHLEGPDVAVEVVRAVLAEVVQVVLHRPDVVYLGSNSLSNVDTWTEVVVDDSICASSSSKPG